MKVVENVTAKVKFLYRPKKYLTPTLKRYLCNTVIQPQFDYGCTPWFLLLNNNLKHKLQAAQKQLQASLLRSTPLLSYKCGASWKNKLAPSFCKSRILHWSTVFKYCNWVLPSYINIFRSSYNGYR